MLDAACPELTAIAATPPSNFAILSSRTAHGRVHDPCINISRVLVTKKLSGVISVIKLIRRGLVNRHGHRSEWFHLF